MTTSPATEDLLRQLLEQLRPELPFDAAALLRLGASGLQPLACLGLTDELSGRRFDPAQHPRLEQLLASAVPLRFDADCALPDPYDGLIDGQPDLLPVHDCMGARLMLDGQVWGLLTLDALRPGAFDPVSPGRLGVLVRQVQGALAEILGRSRDSQGPSRTDRIAAVPLSPPELVGHSPAMRQLHEEIALVALADLGVLILGETGVGKELVARALHAGSARRDAPLVLINCAALPETLAESELFGHRRGAYTGATQDRLGKFELAHGGTLLLDEVGELPLPLQAKLLRVLQSGEIQRPGDDRTRQVDVRILAATNRDLVAEVAQGRFRADLYHRLAVWPLSVPALRERGRDVLALAGAFLEGLQQRLGCRPLRLTAPAKDALLAYDWPGNVRELEHVISRAALRAQGPAGSARGRWISIEPRHLGLTTSPPVAESGDANLQGLREATDDFQRRWLRDALNRHAGNQAAVAREAGMHRSNLFRLLRRLGIPTA